MVDLPTEDENGIEVEQKSISSETLVEVEGGELPESLATEKIDEPMEEKPGVIPPPGSGQKIYEYDPYLEAHRAHLDYR